MTAEKYYSTDHKIGDWVVWMGDDGILANNHVYKIEFIDENGSIFVEGLNDVAFMKEFFCKPSRVLSILFEIHSLVKSL